ncbi:MAG TPA: hypothetical protein VFL91_33325, partial [Thermomicrobiales bacterium]|nr:hypothetical protein [Thermomicrobiales bacterium]
MTNHQFSRTLKTATIPLRLLVVLGMLLGMLGTLVPASPVGASSVTSAQFNGGTGTVTVNGTVFAKKGGALT